MQLVSQLRTIHHQALALAQSAQLAIEEIENLKNNKPAEAPKAAKPKTNGKPKVEVEVETVKDEAKVAAEAPKPVVAAEAPKPAAEAPAVEAPKPAAEPVQGTRVLAGFSIVPPPKGERANLPSKEVLTKKAQELGMPAEEIAQFFQANAKPTNETKLKLLEKLDSLLRAKSAA